MSSRVQWNLDWRFQISNFPLCAAATFCLLMLTAALPAQDRPTEQFVPADQLEAVFLRDRRGVMMTRDEFRKLLDAASAGQASSQLPVPAVIEQVRIDVVPGEQQAAVTMEITVRQLASGWHVLRIPAGNLLLEDVLVDDQPAAVSRDAQDASVLLLAHEGAGPFVAKLTASTTLASLGSDQAAAFQLPQVAAATLTVRCPAGRQLLVDDRRLNRPASDDQEATYEVPVGSAAEVRLRWVTEREQSTTQTLVFVSSSAQVQVQSGAIRWDSESRVSVFGGTINRLVASVPATLEITNVESTGLDAWTLDDDPDRPGRTRVTLTYRQPFTNDRLIRVQGVAVGGSDGAVSSPPQALPTLEYSSVTAHSGRLIVTHQDGLRMMSEAGGGVRRIPAADAGLSADASVFDFWQQSFDLRVSARPRDRELFADSAATLRVDDTSLTFRAVVTIETLNAPLFEVPLTLPAGWQLQNVLVGDVPTSWTAGSQPDEILVRPPQPVAAGGLLPVTVVLSRTISDPDAEQKLTLPVVTALGTTAVGGQYDIQFPDDLIITPLSLTGLDPVCGNGSSLRFQNSGTAVAGELSVLRKPSQLAARSVLRTWADSRQQSVDAEIIADVLAGTIRTVTVRLSESLGPDVRFEVRNVGPVPGLVQTRPVVPVTIIEQVSGEPANGLRPFTLKLDKRFAGSLSLHAFVQRPRDAAAPLAAPVAQLQDAVRQQGVLVFEASPEQQLTAPPNVPQIPGLFVADAGLVDPPAEGSSRRIAAVYRYVQPEYAFSLAETVFPTDAVPSAVCELLANSGTLNESGSLQRWSLARIRSSGVQTLRFTLPDADRSFLWSTRLNGEPVEVRRDGPDYLVAVPAEAGSHAFELGVLFETARDASSAFGRLEQSPLQLAIDAGDARGLPVDVLKQTWRIHYPSTSLLVDSDGQFRPDQGVDQPGWLVSQGRIEWPEWQQLGRRVLPVGVFFLVLFVFALMVQRQRWKSIVAVIGTAGVLWALSMSLNDRRFAAITSEAVHPKSMVVPSPDYLSDEVQLLEPTNAAVAANGFIPAPGPSGMGDGGFGGGGRMDMAPPRAPAPPMAMGGMSGAVAGRESSPAELELSVPQADLDRNTAGLPPAGPQIAAPADRPSVQRDLSERDAHRGRVVAKKGSARLSVKVDLDIPGDFQSRDFTSVADALQQPAVLSVVVQRRSQIAAIRVFVALLVVLLGWKIRSTPLLWKLTVACCVALAAVAVVPLVGNAWQSVVDGVVIGAGIAGLLAVVTSAGACCRIERGMPAWVTRLRRSKAAASLVVVAALAASPVEVAASPQSGADAAVPAVETQEADTQPADQPAVSDDVTTPDLVVPYSLDQAGLGTDRVFLRHDDFLKLYQQAYPQELSARAASPLGSTVVGTYLKTGAVTMVEGTQAVMNVQARFVVWSDSDTLTAIPLPLGPVGVRTVRVDGAAGVLQPLIVGAQAGQLPDFAAQQLGMPQAQSANYAAPAVEGPAFAVQVTGRGPHVVDVAFDLPVQLEGELGRIDMPLRTPVAGVLEWTLPAANLEARVNGRTNVYRRNGTQVLIPIARQSTLRLTWLPAAQRAAGDVVYHASTRTALALEDAGLTLRTTVDVTCRQGELTELEVTIPDGYAVQTVTGGDVAGWEVQNTDDSRAVRLQLRRSVGDATQVTLQLFAPLPDAAGLANLPVPVSIVRGAGRDTGSLTLRSGPQFQVRSDALSGVTQLNPGEALQPEGGELPGRPMLAWRYTRHPASVIVKAVPAADSLEIEAFHAVRLEEQRQLWTSRVTAVMTGAPRSRLDISVPRSMLILDVSATGLRDWYYADDVAPDSPLRTLSILLNDARTGRVDVALQGQMSRDADRDRLSLQPPAVLNATRAGSELAVWLDAASESAGLDTGADWAVQAPATAHACFREIAPQSPSLVFRSSVVSPGSLAVRLRRAVSTLIAETVTITTVTETAVEMTLALNWQVARAAADQFAVELPTALATALTFEVPGQRQLGREDIGNGRTRVSIRLQQPVTDRLFVLGTASLPIPADRTLRAAAPAVVVAANAPSTLSSQSHFWVLVNQSNGLLQPSADQPDDKVTPDRLTTKIPPQLQQQAVAMLKLHSGTAAWSLVYPEAFQVAPAIVNLATHTTILADDGSWRSRHQLLVSNESRQFLPVQLPAGSRLMYCLVQGRPSRVVMRGEGADRRHLIPIPQSGAVAAAFEVEFAIAGRFDGSASRIRKDWTSRRLSIPVPLFPEFRDDPELGITVSRNRWTVFVPESWSARLVDEPEETNVVPATQSELEDASILSYVEQASALLRSAKAAKGAYLQQRAIFFCETSESVLNSNTGNSAEVERQRGEAVSKLRALSSELLAGQQAAGAPMSSGGSGSVGQLFLGNGFLGEQELQSNQWNKSNSDSLKGLNDAVQFVTPGTAADPVPAGDTGGASDKFFRFSLGDAPQLMEEVRDQPASAEDARDKEKGDADRKENEARQEAEGLFRSGGKSSLMQRRQSPKAAATAQNAIPEGVQILLSDGSARYLGQVPVPAQQMQDQADRMDAGARLQVEPQSMTAGASELAARTGLLSLVFEIPTDGQRLDFLRGPGNPEITFDMRSSEAVSRGTGVIWAVLCVIGIVLVFRPGCQGRVWELLLRVTLVLAVGSLAVWLFAVGPIQQIAPPVCVISAIVAAITWAWPRRAESVE